MHEPSLPQFELTSPGLANWPKFSVLGFAYHQLLAAESLWAMRSQTPTRVSESTLIAIITLLFYCRDQGHSCMPLEEIGQLWQERLDMRAIPHFSLANFEEIPPAQSIIAALLETHLATALNAAEPQNSPLSLVSFGHFTRLYLTGDWQRELNLARQIRQLNRPFAALPETSAESDDWRQALAQDSQLDQIQKNAVLRGAAASFFILSGGPGTGKTTIVFHVLRAQAQQFAQKTGRMPNIALCAPTGRAAARLGESLQLSRLRYSKHLTSPIDRQFAAMIENAEGITLHRLLGLSSSFKRPSTKAILPYDLIVVDEASMVDLFLMESLCARVSSQAHLIFVGDPNQLPAVESGEILAQLCAAAPKAKLTHCALETVYRSNRAIIDCAQQVLAGSAEQALAIAAEHSAYIRVTELLANHDQDMQIQGYIANWIEECGLSQLVKQCSSLANAFDAAKIESLFSKIGSSILLTPRHLGPTGTVQLNQLVTRLLNPSEGKFSRNRLNWFPGQMVMVTQNDYDRGLFNGDRGLVFRKNGNLAVFFPGPRAQEGIHPAPQSIPGLEPAFAISIHKSQGSEYERVDLFLTESKSEEIKIARELLYTGITRAKNQLRLCIHPESFAKACAVKGSRWSNLGLLLESELTNS